MKASARTDLLTPRHETLFLLAALLWGLAMLLGFTLGSALLFICGLALVALGGLLSLWVLERGFNAHSTPCPFQGKVEVNS